MTTPAMRAAFSIHAATEKSKDMTQDEWRALSLPRRSLLQDSWSHKVHAFHSFFQRPIGDHTQPMPEDEIRTHHDIIVEEWKELWSAVFMDDLIETLDGGLDLIYTVLGLLIARGIPPHVIDAAFEEIHASNMTKADPETGRPILSPAGKILKGSGYVKADLPAAALNATPSYPLIPVPTEGA